jgi:hypothetical protein
MGDLHGEVKKTRLLDMDLANASQYSFMAIHTLMDWLALSIDEL